jgi:hypothetical protein
MILAYNRPVIDIQVGRYDCIVIFKQGVPTYIKVPFSAISWVDDKAVLSDMGL